MNFSQLKYIVALNEYRNFVKAAESQNVTQPTLSMQVKALEEELSLILFDRSKSPLIPTDIGLEIVNQAKIILQETAKLGELANTEQKEVKGTLKLAILPTIAPYLVPLFLGTFSKKYPKVELLLKEAQTPNIIDMLARDEIDAAILSTPLSQGSIIERVLYYEPFKLFLHEEHPLLSKKEISDKDLSLDEVWLLSEGHCMRYQGLKICSQKEKMKSKLFENIKLESSNLETLKNLVIKAKGVTFLPYLSTIGLDDKVAKYVRPFKSPEPSREISLVYSRFFHKETLLQKIEEEILSSIPDLMKSYKKEMYFVVEPKKDN